MPSGISSGESRGLTVVSGSGRSSSKERGGGSSRNSDGECAVQPDSNAWESSDLRLGKHDSCKQNPQVLALNPWSLVVQNRGYRPAWTDLRTPIWGPWETEAQNP